MAKYKAYPEYKDSGVEWIDSIPSYWEVKPTFALCDASPQKNIDGVESNVLSLSYGNIIPRDVETNFGLLPESFNTYQIISCGDVILRLTDLQNDKNSLRVGLAKQKGIITSAYLKLKANIHMNPGFLYRLLHSYDTTKVFYGMGGGLRQSMKFEDFRRLPLLLPPYEEQIKISAFLDHETAKIDNLIEKQQQLIELLKEKRQAVISHAVTKGLNPDVPMKDSGVEWLGEVPEHWRVSSLSYYSSLNTGATPDRSNSKYWNGDIAWIKTGEVNYNNISSSEEKITPEAVKNTSVRLSPPGTLLMAMYGQGITRGRVAILDINATYNQACVAISPNETLLNVYLRLFFMAGYHAIRDGGNETSQMNLNADIVRKFKILIPPVFEQKQIVSYLDCHIPKIEMLLERACSVITLLQERRTALISAAVTGKIDVRDWVVSNTQGIEEPQEATA